MAASPKPKLLKQRLRDVIAVAYVLEEPADVATRDIQASILIFTVNALVLSCRLVFL